MESPDFKGIEQYLNTNPALRKLYEEHRLLKRKIAKLEKRPFPTTAEEREEQQLKKLKLLGKEKIVRLLETLRNG